MRERARTLRKSATDAENKLWDFLRNKKFHDFKFRRQHGIKNYIVDFVCLEKKLIIELDGSQHLYNKNYDDNRTQALEELGYKIIRFWNDEVFKETVAVLEKIYQCII